MTLSNTINFHINSLYNHKNILIKRIKISGSNMNKVEMTYCKVKYSSQVGPFYVGEMYKVIYENIADQNTVYVQSMDNSYGRRFWLEDDWLYNYNYNRPKSKFSDYFLTLKEMRNIKLKQLEGKDNNG